LFHLEGDEDEDKEEASAEKKGKYAKFWKEFGKAIVSVLLSFFGSTGITRTCSVALMIVSGSYNGRGLHVQDILSWITSFTNGMCL
jgi:hypothetical protein